MPKRSLRSEMLARRSNLSVKQWQTASLMAQERLLRLESFQLARRLALYAPLQNEIDTAVLFAAACRAGKQVLYPQVCGEQLVFHEVTAAEQLRPGSFGILEPCQLNTADEPVALDLMVVPGVAFDLRGHRVGFGKGYYDRYLAGLQQLPFLVGLCHDFQLCAEVPAEGHDVRMHCLVSESRTVQVAVTDRL
jgi:5-formyltetrahydrofolate cyclo-ligase